MRIKKRGPEPIFVVCDGDNPQGTVLLGVKKSNRSIYTSILNVVGCYPNDHEKLSLDEMEKSHQILTRSRSSKINYQTKFKYYVFGNPLQNVKDIYRAEHPGSISIEIRCNKRCHLDLPQNTPNIKNMVLQTIAGHKMSSVYFLWKDLCLLQEYLDIFLSNKGDRLLSPVPLSAVEVFQSIKTIVGTNFWKREAKTKFDLKHIRHENILDKLWGILKYCEDLATLRDAFHCLFEELAETDSNFKIPDSQKCNIAIIINGIIEGKFAVPTLTFYQALEFLFEIGAEKLKNDYQSIIKHFYSTSDSTIAAKWSQLEKKLFPEDSNNKTRVTLNLKGAKADVNNVHSKLAYLSRLHVATELIYLVKNHLFLQADAFDCICERIYKQYVARDASNYDFLALQDNPLCEFETVIDTPNETVIKTELPVSWSMQMTSSLDNLEVTTVYHLSKHPIIPTTIFNNYDVSTADEDSMPYYVCKFESHKEVI
ncbi:hypothetical protein JTB14_024598 [Gonioctena quinquepunctata]|nr:hypothetical protein JTB14_024598 [Gonioctena quinquepunctata]